MNKIKRSKIKEETKLISAILKNCNRISPKMKEKLNEIGYSHELLGTGAQSKSSSGVIKEWNLKNTYLKGNYFGVGIASRSQKGYPLYQAFIKEIKD